MANAIKWEAAPVDRGAVIDLGTTLTDGSASSVGGELDNSVNLDRWGLFELTTSTGDLFSVAVTATNAVVDLYRIQAPDGTNYENTPVTADIAEFPHLYVGSFPIATETGNQPIVIGPFLLPFTKQKYIAHNKNTGQTMQATWEVNLYVGNEEVQ